MPMFMTCTNAVLNPDQLQRIETENETSLLGTLVHGLSENLVKLGSYDILTLKQRLNEEDYERAHLLMHNFLGIWREASQYMIEPQTELALEAELSHFHLTGNIDAVSFNSDKTFILDYKTGRQHEDHYHQMAGYAYLAWAKQGKPTPHVVYVTTVYLEDKAVTPYTFTAEDLVAWEKEVAKQLMQQRYTAGRKCAFCTLQDSCPAYRSFGRVRW
jgi:CRISPR/Cas system-associated exonuclease Cas4 (RecB family)